MTRGPNTQPVQALRFSSYEERVDVDMSLDLLEVGLLVFLFSSLILKGFIAQWNTLFEYLAGFVLFAFVFLRYDNRMFWLSKTVLIYITFATVCLLSVFWADDRYLVLAEIEGMFATVPVLIAIYHICSSSGGVKRVLLSINIALTSVVGLALFLGLYSVGERQFLRMSASGIAPFMLMSFVALFIQWQYARRQYLIVPRLVFVVTPVLLLSSVRWVAVVAIIVAFYVLLLSVGTRKGRIYGVMGMLCLLGVLAYMGSTALTVMESTRYFQHYADLARYLDSGVMEGSVGFRIYVQNLGLDMVVQSPLIGHGLNNSRIMYEQLLGIRTYSHNGFLEVLIGVGAVGFSIFLMLYYEPLRRFMSNWSENKRGSSAALAILAGLFAFNMIGPLYNSAELLIVLVLISSKGLQRLLLSPTGRPAHRLYVGPKNERLGK